MQAAVLSLQSTAAAPMTFRLFTRTGGEPVDTVEMHVLAKAYRAAWRSQYINDPAGLHVIEALDLVIDFGGDGTHGDGLPGEPSFGPMRRRDWG